MRKVKIIETIISPFDQTKIKAEGNYNSKTSVISYNEDDTLINIKIDNAITIQRKHPDYSLELIFEEGKIKNSLYEIKEPIINIKATVDTKVLQRNETGFYIEYNLKLDEQDIGLFHIDFKMEE